MFCPKCGANVPDGSKFCESCGYNVQQFEQSNGQESRQTSPQPTYSPAPTPEYQPQQQTYNYQPRPQPAPAYQNTVNITDPRDNVYSMGGWLGTLLLTYIPIVNIICLLVWAFGSNTNRNKQNFARAMLIIGAVMIVISIILYVVIIAAVGSFFDQLGTFEDFIG
ncbi:MAG: zinc-ribbon domain-containing protein [Clostridiaceae bacterium]|jgi:predicted nucleic acid-binding Zn ribbon protein|nr:zinc-ribbon domain-containing protein [Clostridiaceae bacterium]